MDNYDDKMEVYDDGAFSVFYTSYGMYSSRDKNGVGLCSSLSKEDVVFWSREHLNGFANSSVTVTNTKIGDAVKL
tara:strand:+ start:3686 stop:3910 length:225 start_codon:yes stop_codon:yes gene_type:complete